MGGGRIVPVAILPVAANVLYGLEQRLLAFGAAGATVAGMSALVMLSSARRLATLSPNASSEMAGRLDL